MTDAASSSANSDRVVRAWLDARAERDLDRLATLTALDATWHSPVDGPRNGRAAVVEEVRRGFENTASFETKLLALRQEGATAAARIRNIATREGKNLDSTQTLYLRIDQGMITEIRVRVDDEEEVEEFWK